MNERPTHASFFSGVGGLDLGLERAGWRTVNFSEIDPYASAVLAERWPGVPNLGDIVALERASGRPLHDGGRTSSGAGSAEEHGSDRPYVGAALWTGGFPCQDLSVAGKRRGMVEGTRSNLAYAFLALVERYRPPAILLENVPGLLSSHRGRDLRTLLRRLEELGYGWAFRVLDARHFGVPQRRRRVFIVGLRSDPDDPEGRVAAERAAAVLSVGTRCPRHPATGGEAGPEPSDGTGERPELVGAIPAGQHGFPDGVQEFMQGHFRVVPPTLAATLDGVGSSTRATDTLNLVSPSPDPGGVRAADGLAGRLDDRGLARPLLSNAQGGQRTTDLNAPLVVGGSGMTDDPLLPLGLDSHRYRCCGNGVVAPVAEWLGARLMNALS